MAKSKRIRAHDYRHGHAHSNARHRVNQRYREEEKIINLPYKLRGADSIKDGLEEFFLQDHQTTTPTLLEVLAGKINAFYAMDYRREAKKEIKSLPKAALRCILENQGYLSAYELEVELYNDLLMEGSVKILQGALAICGDDEHLTLQFLERELARLNTTGKRPHKNTLTPKSYAA